MTTDCNTTDLPDPNEPQIRVRPDVWSLDAWDDTLLWFARGIGEMQKRPLVDPTSWRFQGAIHAYRRDGDPYADLGEQLPSADDQRRFWNQCQHSSWYFLPWHRMYLGFFEEMVAAAIEDLGGPSGWSLPYWNYSDSSRPDVRRIPPAFRAETLPDGSPNPLRVAQRVPAANAGDVVADDFDVDLVDALDETVFEGGISGATTGFGGPATLFNHGGGPPGKLEMTPHGSMHVAVGGFSPPGFMSRFNTAALDPLFWMHHANIDRLWTVWKKRDAANVDPTKDQWLDGVSFELHDVSGTVVTLTSADMADSEASRFGYRYEDESDPLDTSSDTSVDDGTEAVAETPAAAHDEEARLMEERPAEMIGATDDSTTLAGQTVTTRVRLHAASARFSDTASEDAKAAAAAPPRLHLSLENIQGSEPVPHLVYINLPEGADPADHPELVAASLSMFGLPEASGENPDHPGSGLAYSIDITKVMESLGQDASADEIQVTLVPKTSLGQDAAGAREAAKIGVSTIEVGRIRVYRSQ